MISLIALLIVIVSFQYVYSSDAVRLRDIQALTFRKNHLTTYRRSFPTNQLNCLWGDCQYRNNINIVQCVNMGVNDNGNVQWKCETQLPGYLSLGKTTVSCEGYNHAGDEFILKDSCALNYELIKDYNYVQPINPYHNTNDNDSVVLFIFLMCLLICTIICFTNYCTFSPSDSHTSSYYEWFGIYNGEPTYYTRQPLYQTNVRTNVSYIDTEIREPMPTILSTLRHRPTRVDIQQPILQEPKVTKVSYADTEIIGPNEKHILQEPKVTKVSYADTEIIGPNEKHILQEPKVSYADTEARESVVEKKQDYNEDEKTDISYADTESR
jgi:hypothetical protein